ncbi:hypothetical protein D3C87_1747820 [compost metagenome]
MEGSTLGKMEAVVDANPPTRNILENKNPRPSFLNVLTLNKPKIPINDSKGNTQSKGFSLKL